MFKARITFITMLSLVIVCATYIISQQELRAVVGAVVKRQYINLYANVAERFLKLELRNENIVVSLTTTPYRIYKLKPVIDGLLAQNVDISRIYLNIPYKFKRDNLEYTIPEWLTKYKKVQILRTEDYGPITKLLPVLALANLSKNTIIVTVDDDVRYPHNLILQLAYKAHKYPDSVAAMSGVNLDYDLNGNIGPGYGNGFVKPRVAEAQVTIVEGFGGVAYRRKFFDDSIFEIESAPQACKNSDDVYISYYLAKNKIKRLTVSNKYISKYNVRPEDYGRAPDALHKQALKELDRHKICIGFLKNKYPNVEF